MYSVNARADGSWIHVEKDRSYGSDVSYHNESVTEVWNNLEHPSLPLPLEHFLWNLQQ